MENTDFLKIPLGLVKKLKLRPNCEKFLNKTNNPIDSIAKNIEYLLK